MRNYKEREMNNLVKEVKEFEAFEKLVEGNLKMIDTYNHLGPRNVNKVLEEIKGRLRFLANGERVVLVKFNELTGKAVDIKTIMFAVYGKEFVDKHAAFLQFCKEHQDELGLKNMIVR